MIDHLSIQEISRRIRQRTHSIQELSQHLPCHLHINSTQDFSLLEVSPSLGRLLALAEGELNLKGRGLLQRIVHPEDLERAVLLNRDYLQTADERSHISFFQRIQFPSSSELHFFFTRGKLLDPGRILNMSIPLQDSSLFNHQMFKLYEDAQFIRLHLHQFNRLTEREITVCKVLCEGNSLSEVAQELGVSRHTLKNHRTNIYRKLEVKNFFEFYYFVSKFKLNR